MKRIDLLALSGTRELTPPDPIKRYTAERGVGNALALSGFSASPAARELLTQSEQDSNDNNAQRVARAMHAVLQAYVESRQELRGWHRDNPSLYARNVSQPALVTALRNQAGQPVEGEERESWRLMAVRYKRPGLASLMMHYTVYLGGETYMRNGLDVGVIGEQLYAGNGELAERTRDTSAIDIAQVPGVVDAILEDIEYIRRDNNIELA